jgi:CAAX protease family protein
VVGPGAFPGTGSQFDALTPLVVSAMLAGPSVSGILLTGLVSGKTGLRELLSRLLRWRVGLLWYAAALAPAPVLAAAVLFSLSLPFPVLAQGTAAVLLSGLVAGLTTVFEEVGWTGFAVLRLRIRYGAFVTAIIVGLVWGSWHLLQTLWVGGAYAGGLPLTLFVSLYFVSAVAQLTAYRVLMVWVYDRTDSLFVATLMHGSLTASTIFLFAPLATGARFLAYMWALAAALWVVVAAVAMANGWRPVGHRREGPAAEDGLGATR